MANMSFNFETFETLFRGAMDGLQDSMAAIKGIGPVVEDIAKQTGSAKLTENTDKFVVVLDDLVKCFESIQENGEVLYKQYKKINEAANG